MAYVAFAETTGGDVFVPSLYAPVAAAKTVSFSALEWSVVAIARQDRLSSLRSPGRLSLALGAVFGGSGHTRLADEKLEGLRRMAVLSWHRGYAVPSHEVRAFNDAGWSPDHYELLLRSISAARSVSQRGTAQ